MAEVTDYAFRKIARENGAGLTFTQMVSAEGVIKNNFNTLRLLSFSQNEKPIGVQLLGKDPKIIGNATAEIVKFNPDVIDINLGCPVEKVIAHKMGAYLLSQPHLIGEIVKAMVKNSNGIPVSVKIRLGYNNKINVLQNAKIIEDNGASMITIHARTKNDGYESKASWEWIAKVKENCSIPVIGNGSIFSAEDAIRMFNETNCDAVLIGRGALGNPFIFNQIKQVLKGKKYEPSIEEITFTALEHIDLLMKEQDFIKSLDKAKKNIIWYFKYQNGIWNLIDDLYSENDFENLKKIILEHSEKILTGYYPEENKNEIKKRFNNKVLFWLTKEGEKVS